MRDTVMPVITATTPITRTIITAHTAMPTVRATSAVPAVVVAMAAIRPPSRQ
jgi:hypothetical protein